MKRYLIGFLIFAFIISAGSYNLFCSQTTSGEKTEAKGSTEKKTTNLTWYKYDEGLAKAKKEKKHIMVYFYTPQCGWCKRMDQYTFGNEEVKKALNKSYVPIKVNGYSGEKVKVDGKQITERQVATMYRVRAHPITWFLKPSGERIAPRIGYADAEEFLYILNWVKDDLYEKISFTEFVKQEQEKKKSEKKQSK
jgi:thioredoxin-related protein